MKIALAVALWVSGVAAAFDLPAFLARIETAPRGAAVAVDLTGDQMTDEVLSFIVRHTEPSAPANYASLAAAEKLALWLGWAADGMRADGYRFGDWYAPYIIGLTGVPRGREVVAGVDDLMRRVAGAAQTVTMAESYYFSQGVAARINADRPDVARDERNYIVWGHSAGGSATVRVVRELEGRRVRLVMPIDAALWFSWSDALDFARCVPVVNFYQRYPPFPGVSRVRRGGVECERGGDELRSVHVDRVEHFGIVSKLYDDGLIQMAIARVMFRSASR